MLLKSIRRTSCRETSRRQSDNHTSASNRISSHEPILRDVSNTHRASYKLPALQWGPPWVGRLAGYHIWMTKDSRMPSLWVVLVQLMLASSPNGRGKVPQQLRDGREFPLATARFPTSTSKWSRRFKEKKMYRHWKLFILLKREHREKKVLFHLSQDD